MEDRRFRDTDADVDAAAAVGDYDIAGAAREVFETRTLFIERDE